MSAFRPWPKFSVLVQTEGGWTPARWPAEEGKEEGEPAWRHAEDDERAAAAALRDAEALTEHYPDSVLSVVDPEGRELHRFEPVTACPF